MKKILVLGSNNMAGHLIYNFLREKNEFSLFGIKEEKFDLYSYSFTSKINKLNWYPKYNLFDLMKSSIK